MVVALSQGLANYVLLAKSGLHLVFVNIVLGKQPHSFVYVLSIAALKGKTHFHVFPLLLHDCHTHNTFDIRCVGLF